MIKDTLRNQLLPPHEIDLHRNLIKSTSTTKYILISMTTPFFDLLWPQLVTKYNPAPIFLPHGGNKAWRTNLGDSSLGWKWEGSGQVHYMMQRMYTISIGMKFWNLPENFSNSALCASRLRLRECRWHYKHKPTTEGYIVYPEVVFSGMVWVAWTPNPLWKDTSQITFRAEKSKWMTEACLDNSGFLRDSLAWVFWDKGWLGVKKNQLLLRSGTCKWNPRYECSSCKMSHLICTFSPILCHS